jgi:hypothetical protein
MANPNPPEAVNAAVTDLGREVLRGLGALDGYIPGTMLDIGRLAAEFAFQVTFETEDPLTLEAYLRGELGPDEKKSLEQRVRGLAFLARKRSRYTDPLRPDEIKNILQERTTEIVAAADEASQQRRQVGLGAITTLTGAVRVVKEVPQEAPARQPSRRSEARRIALVEERCKELSLREDIQALCELAGLNSQGEALYQDVLVAYIEWDCPLGRLSNAQRANLTFGLDKFLALFLEYQQSLPIDQLRADTEWKEAAHTVIAIMNRSKAAQVSALTYAARRRAADAWALVIGRTLAFKLGGDPGLAERVFHYLKTKEAKS